MKNLTKLSTVAILAFAVTACSNASTAPKGADLGQVLDRTVVALEFAEKNFEKPEGEAESEAQLERLTTVMAQAMNSTPRFHNQPVGITLREDASFLGFEDKNGNNISDAGEKDMFTVEIDGERSRIIATDVTSGEGTYRISGGGLFAGYMLGRLMGRQSRAGVKPSSFAGSKAKSTADYRKSRPAQKAKPAQKARSRTRSGSSRSGK